MAFFASSLRLVCSFCETDTSVSLFTCPARNKTGWWENLIIISECFEEVPYISLDLLQMTMKGTAVIWKQDKVTKGSITLYIFLQIYNLCFI